MGGKPGLEVKRPRAKEGVGIFSSDKEHVHDVYLSRIIDNPWQPRFEIPEEDVVSLANSIKQHGLMHPVVLRKSGEKYEIVAGHRRAAAHRFLGKETIPSIVRVLTDADMKIQVAIENIQRKDLSAFEIASYLDMIAGEEKLNGKELAEKLDLTESYVSRHLGLLTLSPEIKNLVKERKYTNIKVLNALLKVESSLQIGIIMKIIDESLTTDHALSLVAMSLSKKVIEPAIVNTKSFFVVKEKGKYALKIDEAALSDEQKKKLDLFIESLK